MESVSCNEFHIVQRLFRLAVLQFGHGAQLQNLRARFSARPDAAAKWPQGDSLS
jgi:hypothetical protein